MAQYRALIYKLSYQAIKLLPRDTIFEVDDLYQEGAALAVHVATRYRPLKARASMSQPVLMKAPVAGYVDYIPAFEYYLTVSLKHRYGAIVRREWRARGGGAAVRVSEEALSRAWTYGEQCTIDGVIEALAAESVRARLPDRYRTMTPQKDVMDVMGGR